MRGESVNGGRHHSTRAAPVGVEIDGDGHLAVVDGACEGLVVQRKRTLEENRLGALTAFWTVGHLAGVDAVPRIAKLTTHRELETRRFRFSLHSILRDPRVSR